MDLRKHVRNRLRFCLFHLTRRCPFGTLLKHIPDLMSLIRHFAVDSVVGLICQRLELKLSPALADCLKVAENICPTDPCFFLKFIEDLWVFTDFHLDESGRKRQIIFCHFKFRSKLGLERHRHEKGTAETVNGADLHLINAVGQITELQCFRAGIPICFDLRYKAPGDFLVNPVDHLLCRFFGKGDGNQFLWPCLFMQELINDAIGEDIRLSRAGSSFNQVAGMKCLV